MNIILEGFENLKDIVNQYQSNNLEELGKCSDIYATYECSYYEGTSYVLYILDGKLFEVNGAHCSCYGLEGQWEPEETKKEAILMRVGLDIKLIDFLEKI